MEPQIRYAKTSDGVSIAYYAIGAGPAIVVIDLPHSHLLAEWRVPGQRSVYEATARVATLVRYDHRGFGLSERDVTDFGIEAMLRDLEAVVERLGLKSFRLIARGAIPIAVTYAATHAERMSHLVLSLGFVRLPDSLLETLEALFAMPNRDWRFVSESVSRVLLGWDDDDAARHNASLLREAVTLETFQGFTRDMGRWDATDRLSDVSTPTLLISTKGHSFYGPEHARKIASLMPDARVVVLDGATAQERGAQSLAAMTAFLVGTDLAPPAPSPIAPPTRPSGTAIILFADIVDSTALTERLGDAAFRAKARDLDGALRAAIRERGGTPIDGKLLGDGVLAVFTSAREAIEAALACGEAGRHAGLPLHLGLHAGDVIRESDADGRANVYGGAVNIASRISALSAPGEVLVSETVRSLARTSAGVAFEDRGEQSLKGVGEAVRVWAVVEDGPG